MTFAAFRYAVLVVAGLLALAGFAAMAVQRRTISPFSRTARLIRRFTDWLLKPLERRMVRQGFNPVNAPWWLVWIGVVGGILLITAAQWLVNEAAVVVAAGQSGGGSLRFMLVSAAFSVLEIAIIVRVIGSWIGADRYTRWMRPFVWLTEWLLAPLRRVIPTAGMFDLSPLVAWLLVMLARGWVLGLLARPLTIGGVGAR